MSVLALAAAALPQHHHQHHTATPPPPSPRPFACHYANCNKTFSRVSKLQAHLCVHTGERPFPCTYAECSSAFTSASKLQEHVKKAHTGTGEAKRFICDECGKGFGTGQHLKRHKEGVHDRGASAVASTSATPIAPTRPSYPCTEHNCNASFSKRKHLRQHIWEAHSDGDESSLPFPCSHAGCTKRFPTNSKRRSHYKVAHSGGRQYTCALHDDELQFPTWSALQTHMREAHPPTCPYESCKGKVFKRQENLKAHLARHRARELGEDGVEAGEEEDDPLADESDEEDEAPSREIVCDWRAGDEPCTKRFKSTHARDTHIRVAHLKLRPFSCPCGKAYGHKHLLKRHQGKCKSAESAAPPVTPSELGSDEEDEVYRRGGGALPDALRDVGEGGAKRKRGGEEQRPSLLVDLLTGRGYADGSSAGGNKRRRMRGRVVACPWPKIASGDGEEHCPVRFSRLYDMRRHLKAAHHVEVKDDAELRVLLDEEEVGKLAKPRRSVSVV